MEGVAGANVTAIGRRPADIDDGAEHNMLHIDADRKPTDR